MPGENELHLAAGCGPPALSAGPTTSVTSSALVIGVTWANHHALFEYIRRANRTLIVANLLLLMGVGFLPFLTVVLADHLADPATRAAATVFYGATLIFTSLTFNLLWWVGRWRRHVLGTELSGQGLRTIARCHAVAPVCYAGATSLAFVNVWLSLSIHVATGFVERLLRTRLCRRG